MLTILRNLANIYKDNRKFLKEIDSTDFYLQLKSFLALLIHGVLQVLNFFTKITQMSIDQDL